jgi:hypothetical protein
MAGVLGGRNRRRLYNDDTVSARRRVEPSAEDPNSYLRVRDPRPQIQGSSVEARRLRSEVALSPQARENYVGTYKLIELKGKWLIQAIGIPFAP